MHTLPAHPRLILRDDRIPPLLAASRGDADLGDLIALVRRRANALLGVPPLTRVVVGTGMKRMLETSRQALARILALAMAYRLEADARWRDRAIAELDAVCAFVDWHPAHFLDTGEMMTAVAIGYDWLWRDLDEVRRATIRAALIEKGIRPALDAPQWWRTSANNWNQVCYAGLACAALALAEDEPALADQVIALCRDGWPLGLEPYAPAGVYPEGPMYWEYGTTFTAVMASAVATALDEDWRISAKPGFLASFAFVTHAYGPTGLSTMFADAWPHPRMALAHLWASGACALPHLAAPAWDDIAAWAAASDVDADPRSLAHRLLPLGIAWYAPRSPAAPPLDWVGDGGSAVHVAMFRSAWHDRDAAFASLKGGALQVNHGHLDAGAFIVELGGVRWAHDLGVESAVYDRTDSWSTLQESPRWRFFRMRNHGHNTLTIGDALQRVAGSSPIIRHAGDADGARAVIDLGDAYASQARAVRRGLALVDGRRQVLVQDEIEDATAAIRWTMVTRATVAIADARTAVLTQDGRRVVATIASGPATARFAVASAAPGHADEMPNEGFSRLLIDIPAPARGIVRLTVAFSLGSARPVQVSALASW